MKGGNTGEGIGRTIVDLLKEFGLTEEEILENFKGGCYDGELIHKNVRRDSKSSGFRIQKVRRSDFIPFVSSDIMIPSEIKIMGYP